MTRRAVTGFAYTHIVSRCRFRGYRYCYSTNPTICKISRIFHPDRRLKI